MDEMIEEARDSRSASIEEADVDGEMDEKGGKWK